MTDEAKSGFGGIAEALAAAEEALGSDVPEVVETPVSVEPQESVDEDAVVPEQPADGELEQPLPTKLADLIKAVEEQSDEDSPQIDDDTVFEVDGEKKTLKELKEGYLRRKDYTKKTQQTAEFSRENERAVALYDALKGDPTSTIAQLALEAQLIDQAQFEAVTAGRQQSVARSGLLEQPGIDEDTISALVAAKVAEVLNEDQAITSVRQSQRTNQIVDSLRALEGKYELALDDADRAAVLQTAVDMQEPNLEVVLLQMLRQVESEGAVRDRVKQAAGGKLNSTKVPKEVNPRPKSVREAWQMAEAQN